MIRREHIPTAPRNARIHERMRRDILVGAFGFGERLKIADLARRYRISHMPVREALRQLDGEGLVEIEPNRGARTRVLDTAFVSNIFDIRIGIEGLLARRAAERISAEQLERLRATEQAFKLTARKRELGMVLAANRNFHDLIGEAAGNREAQAIAERHWALITWLWHTFHYPMERLAGVIADHRQILDAIASRDPDTAQALAAAHVAKARGDLLARMQAAGAK